MHIVEETNRQNFPSLPYHQGSGHTQVFTHEHHDNPSGVLNWMTNTRIPMMFPF